MGPIENFETRFGPDASKAVAGRIGNPPVGNSDLQPAPKDRARGALMGAVVGEALGEPVEDRPRNWIIANLGLITGHVIPNPKTGSDTQLTLITADSILAGAVRRSACRDHHRYPWSGCSAGPGCDSGWPPLVVRRSAIVSRNLRSCQVWSVRSHVGR